MAQGTHRTHAQRQRDMLDAQDAWAASQPPTAAEMAGDLAAWRLDSAEDVRGWLRALDAYGLLWHLEDTAQSVAWSVPVPPDLIELLEWQRQGVWRIARRDGFDPFDLYPACDPEPTCPVCDEPAGIGAWLDNAGAHLRCQEASDRLRAAIDAAHASGRSYRSTR